jgi:hypothetical protein
MAQLLFIRAMEIWFVKTRTTAEKDRSKAEDANHHGKEKYGEGEPWGQLLFLRAIEIWFVKTRTSAEVFL